MHLNHQPFLYEVSRMSLVSAARLAKNGLVLFLLSIASPATLANTADPSWSTKLDNDVSFYQPTEMGVLVAGTKKSLYGVDSESGQVVWRRRNIRVDQTGVVPV